MACLKSLQAARQLGMVSVIVETDSTTLVQAIKGTAQDHSAIGVIFREIKVRARLNFSFFEIVFCPRGCNKVADSLAAHCARMGHASSALLADGAPNFVHALVASDLAGRSG